MPRQVTRRRFLEASAIGSLAGLTGCTSLPSSVDDTAKPADDTETQPSGEQEVQQVGEAIRPAVVVVDTQTGGATGSGRTGWFIDDGHVITNSHVIDGASSITCWTLAGESFETEVIASTDYRSQPYHDVALLRTEFDAPETLSLGDESTLRDGQTVVQVGHPFAIGNWVIASGEYVRKQEFGDAILTTTPNMSGNSGSPLVTMEREVVGLTTGGVPKERSDRRPGEAPEPVAPTVHDTYQNATYATHDPASLVEQYVDEWTSE